MEDAKTLNELLRSPIRGKRIFVRADLNVPLRDGVIRDDSRIRASLPTLRKLAGAGARVIVASRRI
jgi:phosphoglycerate kinase